MFVSGNPGNTQRRTTLAAIKGLRDKQLPVLLNYFCRMEVALQQFASESPEHQRRASKDLVSVQNSRKALTGMLQGLQTPEFIRTKEQSRRITAHKTAGRRLNCDKFDDAWQED